MTSTSENRPRHIAPKARSRAAKNLLTTIPIVLAGSMAMTMNVTGPIEPGTVKRADRPKTSPSELAKNVKEAFASAVKSSTNPVAGSVSEGAISVASVAPSAYRVVAGDTVSSIAGRYGIATASVLALNGLGWKSVIFPGQVLKLSTGAPVAVASAPAAASSNRYTIQKGDTIGGISAKFGVSTQAILSANGLGWSSIIYPGQTLAIPVSTTPALATTPVVQKTPVAPTTTQKAPQSGYVIQTGDTVSKIAAKFGVTAQALLDANGLGWSSIIYTGRTLAIPGVAMIAAASITSTSPSLAAEMAANAKTIIAVGRSLKVPDYGIVVALAAAAQESKLSNISYGDRDSVGLFQQRPSSGWGTKAHILEPTYAARLFFGGPSNPNKGKTKGLLDIAGWQSMSVTQAAQAVQRSGYPNAYAQWESPARSWLKALG